MEVPDASEIIDGLFVGTAEAGIEATVGANCRQIRYILNVGGCVTPAMFAAVAEALAENVENGNDDGRGTKTLAWNNDQAVARGPIWPHCWVFHGFPWFSQFSITLVRYDIC